MPIIKQNEQNKDQNSDAQLNANGVVTVNDANNPTPQDRDERIGNEPDTDRLRSERESVQQSEGNSKH